MTDQERPVEERNELLDDLLSAANNSAAETTSPKQDLAAADEQPKPAEQPAATAADTAPVTAPAEDAADVADETAGADASAEEPAAPAAAEEPSASAEADAASAMPVVEAAAAAASAATEIAPVVESADVAPVAAEEPAVADAATAEAPAAEAESTSAAEAPAAEAESTSAATAEASAAEAEGASYTPVAEEDSGRPRRVKDLEPGMELQGRVTSVALYGIFVDIGVGRDGLVHISEMSDTRIDSPSDLVQIGDLVTVRVKSVEPDGRRISLTMRSKDRGEARGGRGRKKSELDRERLASLRVGDNVEGTVTSIAPFGVFVDIGVGKDGLVHISELSEGRVDKAEDVVVVGETYPFKILEVDAEGTRISLSLRRAQRTQRLQQIEKGQILEGKVSGTAPFGAFVDLGVGRDGLVHITELAEGRIEKVEDAVKVGDTVTVRVLDVDPQSKRISLSLRLDDRPREAPAPRPDGASERAERGPRQDRGSRADRGPRPESVPAEAATTTYMETDEPEEEITGDATLQDLVSKFGGSGKRDRRRRQEETHDDDDDRFLRRQRDAIRRTLQHLGEDD
jgi:predicted RNA-binding protein with RPS1 domain